MITGSLRGQQDMDETLPCPQSLCPFIGSKWRCPLQVSVEDKVVKRPGATSSTDVRRLLQQPKGLTLNKSAGNSSGGMVGPIQGQVLGWLNGRTRVNRWMHGGMTYLGFPHCQARDWFWSDHWRHSLFSSKLGYVLLSQIVWCGGIDRTWSLSSQSLTNKISHYRSHPPLSYLFTPMRGKTWLNLRSLWVCWPILIKSEQWSDLSQGRCSTRILGKMDNHLLFAKTLSSLDQIERVPLRLLHHVNLLLTNPTSIKPQSFTA